MDWGFLEIFKKAEFNTLILAIAITGWIIYRFNIQNYFLRVAILASSYCIIRLIVFIFQYSIAKINSRRYKRQQKKEKEMYIRDRIEKRNLEIIRMFEVLSKDNKRTLFSLFSKGEGDSRNSNILYFNMYEDFFIDQAISFTQIFRNEYGVGQPTMRKSICADKISLEIDPLLYSLIKQSIEKMDYN